MRKFLVAGAVALALQACTNHDTPSAENAEKPAAASQHTTALNASVDGMLNEYYELTKAFVDWDSANINQKIDGLDKSLNTLKLDELSKDSANATLPTALSYVAEIKANTRAMQKAVTFRAKRDQINPLSDNMFTLLKAIRYDAKPVFLQECPMALNDEQDAGVWLSNQKAIHNPYFGTKDKRYGNKMLSCGSVKTSINTPAE